jgi:hypothetical protein
MTKGNNSNELTPVSTVLLGNVAKEFFRILCKLKVHHRLQKSAEPAPVLSQINTFQSLQPIS